MLPRLGISANVSSVLTAETALLSTVAGELGGDEADVDSGEAEGDEEEEKEEEEEGEGSSFFGSIFSCTSTVWEVAGVSSCVFSS
jgi:hypothetical protein